MAEHSDLVAKVDRLRKDILWTKCIAGLLLVSLVAVIVGERTKHPEIVEATRFVLKDDAGNVLAKLGSESFGSTCLTLSARAAAAASQLCVADDGGSLLDLHNRKTESRVLLTPGFTGYEPNTSNSSDFGPLMPLFNGGYHPLRPIPAGLVVEENMFRSYLRFNLSDHTEVVIGHGKNQVVVLSENPDKSSITLFSREGKPIWSTRSSTVSRACTLTEN
jgi:hypothetical protein